MIRRSGVLAGTVLLLLAYAIPVQAAPKSWWKPRASAAIRWQIQFTGRLDLSVNATVFDVDGDGTTAAQVATLHKRGAKAICYVSAGSYEDWRADAKRFPAAVLGADLDGWPGEKWLDVRRWDVLGPIMKARFQGCARKGFDAVDPDNLDGYANSNGVGLTAADQLTYNRRIAALAHGLGLAVGLKNDLDQVKQLAPAFDFAVNEQCAYYHECELLTPFVAQGKPVFEIEYEVTTSTFCPASRKLGFAAIRKKQSLSEWRQTC
ncbi:endo alpha-1,4 polygalactosaminidase [Winogradskya humida]|uniref:endo alpha-1,4 polygalactosaminidase n=1 Tax=Winogradskya humida TaxID=113566 RepID=UPI001EF2933B|nr:endo alpha-1,4 polygalactosaminidase [Actinoplanes humidus]